MVSEGTTGGLEKGLRQRHMTMISLGGVIGAGLFVGSGAVMNATGPGAILSYLAAGVLVVLVMRMLGEMAVARPVQGSFMEYARQALGSIVAIVAVIGAMALVDDVRDQLWWSLASLAVVVGLAAWRTKRSSSSTAGTRPSVGPRTAQT